MAYLSPSVECTIFTTNPEEGSERLNNIINYSTANSSLLRTKSINIIGMRDGKLHDRYLILVNGEGIAEGGYHFSNSLQRANLNHPLLVTPIPQNTLLKVVEYCDFLFDEVYNDNSVSEDNKFIEVYSSKNSSELIKKTRNISSHLFDNPGLREFLAIWLKDDDFLTLEEQNIKERLEISGLLEGDFFKASIKIPLESVLKMDDNKSYVYWEGLSCVLASSHIFEDLKSLIPELEGVDLKSFLNYFLLSKFERSIERESEAIPLTLLKSDIKTLMASSRLVEHFSSYSKDINLTWGDYFAIKLYMEFYPDDFILFVDKYLSTMQSDSKISFIMINQCVNLISTYISINKNGSDIIPDGLESGLLQWFKMNEILNDYISNRSSSKLNDFISDKDLDSVIFTLGWFANAIKKERHEFTSIEDIVYQLSLVLCEHKGEYSAKVIIDSIRGHMPRFGWNVGWGYNEYILPLIKNNLILIDDFCIAINDELIKYFDDIKERTVSFSASREGMITAIAASYLLNSSPDTQVSCLSKLLKVIKESKNIIQRPFESAIDWERWDAARYIILWCKTYISFINKLCEDHGKSGLNMRELDDLIEASINFIGGDPDIYFREDYQVMETLYENMHVKLN